MALHLKKHDLPSPKDALCQLWLKLAQWILRRRFLKFVIVFLLFRYYFSLEKDGPFIWKNLKPQHPRMLCAKFGYNWPCGSWEEDENVKSLQTDGQTDGRTTDNRRSEKFTWAFSFGVLKRNSEIITEYSDRIRKSEIHMQTSKTPYSNCATMSIYM